MEQANRVFLYHFKIQTKHVIQEGTLGCSWVTNTKQVWNCSFKLLIDLIEVNITLYLVIRKLFKIDSALLISYKHDSIHWILYIFAMSSL